MNQSKNASRADNQQERLIKIGWIIGFVDGEGCFSIGFIKQPEKTEQNRLRRGYKTGYQVTHEFVVTQGEKSLPSLEILKEYFGVGRIYVNHRKDNHKEPLYRYAVRNREELNEVIIPFFKKYSLKTAKKEDFGKFEQCLKIILKGEHLTSSGLQKILAIANSMNRKKIRQLLTKNPQRPHAKPLH